MYSNRTNSTRVTPQALEKGFMENNLAKLIGAGLVGLLGLILFLGSWVVVPAGSRGVVTHMGKIQEEVLDEGFHLKLPIVTDVHKISVRVQKSEVQTDAASKDLQKIEKFVIAVNWHIDPSKVNETYQRLGGSDDVVGNILAPNINEVLKAATSKRNAEEIFQQREALKIEIDKQISLVLKEYNVIVDGVSVVDLDFTQGFNHAVEAKQIAEQKAKQAEYEAQRAEVDARAAVNKAEGEAQAKLKLAKAESEANALKLKTLTPELIRYEMVTRWNGETPKVVMGQGGMGMFNMSDLAASKSEK